MVSRYQGAKSQWTQAIKRGKKEGEQVEEEGGVERTRSCRGSRRCSRMRMRSSKTWGEGQQWYQEQEEKVE